MSDHPLVGDVRGRGMLAAIELVTDKNKKTPLPAAATSCAARFRPCMGQRTDRTAFAQRGAGLCPAAMLHAHDEIDAIIERTRKTLDQTLEDPDVRAAMREKRATSAAFPFLEISRERTDFAILCRRATPFRRIQR